MLESLIGRASRSRALATNAIRALLAVVFVASPTQGELLREPRPLAGIDSVVLNAIGDLEIVQGATESLVIEAEPRVLRRIATCVDRRTLTIETKGGFSTRERARFVLHVKTLTAIESGGSGSIHAGTINAERMRVTASGSSDVKIDELTAHMLDVDASGTSTIAIGGGSVDQARLRIAGAAGYTTPRLRVGEADVDAEGSADVVAFIDKSLSVAVGGAARVTYRGNPRLTQQVDGASIVVREQGD